MLPIFYKNNTIFFHQVALTHLALPTTGNYYCKSFHFLGME